MFYDIQTRGVGFVFTWNFQYISKARLAEAFQQLMLDPKTGDILIRIHTAIHQADEAVDLAKFIKTQVPEAHIFGTSTSAVISWGRLSGNQCVISVTQMSEGSIRSCQHLTARRGSPSPRRRSVNMSETP